MDAALSSPGNDSINSSVDNQADSSVNTAEDSVELVRECPRCGAEVAADAAYCPDCKWAMTPLSTEERAAAAVSYFVLAPAAVILLLPAFRKNRFVRFHAWQSLSLWIVFFILSGTALLLSNVAAAMVFLLFGILVSLAMLFLWIVLSLKAWQGVRFELPLFGKLAARLSSGPRS
jgi:uncharacterized membrane protein